MIFDYSLYFSFIFSILISGITLGVFFQLRQLTRPHVSSQNDFTTNKVNRVNLFIKIIYIFMGFIIFSRIVSLLIIPMELQSHAYFDNLYSIRFAFLILNTFFSMLFVTAFFLILIGYSLKLEYRLIYLKYLFLILSFIFIMDLLINSLIYTLISFKMMFPEWIIPNVPVDPAYSHSPVFISMVTGLLMVFTVFYFMIKKRNHRYVTISYNLLFLLTLTIIISGIWRRLSYFFNDESLLYSSMSLLNINEWFIGWFILVIMMCAFSAYIVSIIMMVLRYKFLHFNFGLHYILEFNRIAILSLYGLAAICFLPNLLMYWYH